MKKNLNLALFLFVGINFAGPLICAETILQKEKLSFEKCLGVIKTSAERLSREAIITEEKDNFRAVQFQMEDGILSITCDGNAEEVVVSSK